MLVPFAHMPRNVIPKPRRVQETKASITIAYQMDNRKNAIRPYVADKAGSQWAERVLSAFLVSFLYLLECRLGLFLLLCCVHSLVRSWY